MQGIRLSTREIRQNRLLQIPGSGFQINGFDILHGRLVPDTACPVCGSTDHPHLAHPSALNDMVTNIRRRREELNAMLDATSQRLGAATRSLAAAEVRRTEANRRITTARSQVSAAESAYGVQRPILSELCEKAGLAAIAPLVLNDQSATELATLGAKAKADRVTIASPLAEARRLRTEID
ncbi:MAG TPA: hypothetical protein VGN05_07950, partial [Parvibaculum sp.]